MLTASLLLTAFFAVDIRPNEKPVYQRDLLSMYAAKRTAMLMQTIPGSPFAAGGGGAATSPGGLTTEVQFNNAGAFDGDSTFTFNVGTSVLTMNVTQAVFGGEVQIPVNNKLWAGVSTVGTIMIGNTTQTPDAMAIAVGTASRGLLLIEGGDEGFDFAHAQQPNPTFIVHSAAQSTTQYLSITHNGTDALLVAGAGGVRLAQNVLVDGYISTTGIAATGAILFQPSVTALTPDSGSIWTGTTANSVHVGEFGDSAFDFNNGACTTSACAQPALIIHSATQNTTNYNHLNSMGSQGGTFVTLTDNVATPMFHTPTLSANGHAYAGNGSYSIYILDGASEMQVVSGNFEWYAFRANTGGTVAGIQQIGNDGVLPGLPLQAQSAGTNAVTLTATVAANVATFNITSNTSLTPTLFFAVVQANARFVSAELIPQ